MAPVGEPMTPNLILRGPAPLDPDQARTELLLTLVLLSQLGVVKTSARDGSVRGPRPALTSSAVGRRIRKRQPVRPPRACCLPGTGQQVERHELVNAQHQSRIDWKGWT